MYLGNLAAEQARRRITNEQMSVAIGMSKESIEKKKNGTIDFKLSEMVLIRNTFFPDCTLDYLFQAVDEST